MQEVKQIRRLFLETRQSLEKEDSQSLKQLSNQTINTASRTHDPDNIATAVTIYALSKMVSRESLRNHPDWPLFVKQVNKTIEGILAALERNDERLLRKHLTQLRKHMKRFFGSLREEIDEVLRRAEINKASRIYDHGISQERTAKLLGVSVWELQQAISTTSDQAHDTETLFKKRLKLVEELFA